MIGYVIRMRGYTIPPIGVEVFDHTYVYIVLSSHFQVSSNFNDVYRVEFEPTGGLLKGLDGDAYHSTKITYLELV